jgi:hypothetical protein
MMRLSWSLALCTVLALAPACGDDDDDGGGTPDAAGGGPDGGAPDAGGPTIADVCGPGGLFVDLFKKIIDCNPEFEFILGAIDDAAISAACENGLGKYVEDGSVVLAGQAALDACAQYISAGTCETLDIDEPGPCEDVFVGTVPANGACEDNVQCAGDSWCDETAGTTCGTCRPQKDNGMTCVADDECKGGRCKPMVGGPATCTDLADAGEACATAEDCRGNRECVAQKCEAPTLPTTGDGCDNGMNFENAIGACASIRTGLYCKPVAPGTTLGTCQPFAALSATCTPLGQVNMNNWCDFTKYETCMVTGMAQTGTCVAPTIVNAGQACSLIQGRKCADGLLCGDHDGDAMTPDECFAPLAEGDTCDPQNNRCDVFLSCDETTMKCRYDYTGMCPAQ